MHLQAASDFSSQLSGPAPSQEVLHALFWHSTVKLASSLLSNIWICSQLKERQDGCSTEDNNGEAIRLIGRETLVGFIILLGINSRLVQCILLVLKLSLSYILW